MSAEALIRDKFVVIVFMGEKKNYQGQRQQQQFIQFGFLVACKKTNACIALTVCCSHQRQQRTAVHTILISSGLQENQRMHSSYSVLQSSKRCTPGTLID